MVSSSVSSSFCFTSIIYYALKRHKGLVLNYASRTLTNQPANHLTNTDKSLSRHCLETLIVFELSERFLILCRSKGFYRAHISPPFFPVLSQRSPFHALTSSCCNIHLILSFHQRLDLPTCLTFLGFSTRQLYEILICDNTRGNTSLHLWEK